MNETKLRAALIEARDWFESQAKDASKGCGPSYELHDLRVQRDALDAALAAAPAQAARQPLTDAQVQKIVIAVCDSIYPQGNASYSEADSVFYGAFARAIEHHHGIK